jgi:hypothetical protein
LPTAVGTGNSLEEDAPLGDRFLAVTAGAIDIAPSPIRHRHVSFGLSKGTIGIGQRCPQRFVRWQVVASMEAVVDSVESVAKVDHG